MPKANWGIKSNVVDDFDRDSQYVPYSGPIPPDGVYLWQIKVIQFIAKTREKNAQLRVGLELIPRGGDYNDDAFDGYFSMAFLPVTDKTSFRYVPFLDAIGVSGREFTNGTITDEEGNIKKIGRWRNDGEQYVLAQLKTGTDQNGDPRKEIGTFMEAPDFEADEDEEEEDIYDDEED